jgi:predicted  nucleic acid-binding Zn-ribbon protein
MPPTEYSYSDGVPSSFDEAFRAALEPQRSSEERVREQVRALNAADFAARGLPNAGSDSRVNDYRNPQTFENPYQDLQGAHDTVRAYGVQSASGGYGAAINAADRINQQTIDADRNQTRSNRSQAEQALAAGGLSPDETNRLQEQLQYLKLREQGLYELYLSPATARANMAFACIRSGIGAYVSYGEQLLNQAVRLRPEIELDPYYQQHKRDAYLELQRKLGMVAVVPGLSPGQGADIMPPGTFAPPGTTPGAGTDQPPSSPLIPPESTPGIGGDITPTLPVVPPGLTPGIGEDITPTFPVVPPGFKPGIGGDITPTLPVVPPGFPPGTGGDVTPPGGPGVAPDQGGDRPGTGPQKNPGEQNQRRWLSPEDLNWLAQNPAAWLALAAAGWVIVRQGSKWFMEKRTPAPADPSIPPVDTKDKDKETAGDKEKDKDQPGREQKDDKEKDKDQPGREQKDDKEKDKDQPGREQKDDKEKDKDQPGREQKDDKEKDKDQPGREQKDDKEKDKDQPGREQKDDKEKDKDQPGREQNDGKGEPTEPKNDGRTEKPAAPNTEEGNVKVYFKGEGEVDGKKVSIEIAHKLKPDGSHVTNSDGDWIKRVTYEVNGRKYVLEGSSWFHAPSFTPTYGDVKLHVTTVNAQDLAKVQATLIPELFEAAKPGGPLHGKLHSFKTINPINGIDSKHLNWGEVRPGDKGQDAKGFTIYATDEVAAKEVYDWISAKLAEKGLKLEGHENTANVGDRTRDKNASNRVSIERDFFAKAPVRLADSHPDLLSNEQLLAEGVKDYAERKAREKAPGWDIQIYGPDGNLTKEAIDSFLKDAEANGGSSEESLAKKIKELASQKASNKKPGWDFAVVDGEGKLTQQALDRFLRQSEVAGAVVEEKLAEGIKDYIQRKAAEKAKGWDFPIFEKDGRLTQQALQKFLRECEVDGRECALVYERAQGREPRLVFVSERSEQHSKGCKYYLDESEAVKKPIYDSRTGEPIKLLTDRPAYYKISEQVGTYLGRNLDPAFLAGERRAESRKTAQVLLDRVQNEGREFVSLDGKTKIKAVQLREGERVAGSDWIPSREGDFFAVIDGPNGKQAMVIAKENLASEYKAVEPPVVPDGNPAQPDKETQDKASEKHEELKRQIDELTKAQKDAAEKIADLEKSLKDSRESAEAKKAGLERQIQELTAAQQESQRKAAELQTKLQDTTTTTAAEKAQLEKQIQDLTQTQKESQNKAVELQKKLEDSTRSAEAEKAQLQRQLQDLTKGQQEAQGKVAELQRKLQEAGDAAKVSAADKTQLEKQIQDLTRAQQESQTKAEALQKQLKDVEAKSAADKAQLEKQVQDLTRAQQESQNTATELQRKLQETTGEKAQLQREMQELQRNQQESQTKVAELERKLKESATATANEKEQLNKQIQDLTRQQKESQEKVVELQRKLQQTSAEKEQLEKQVKNLTDFQQESQRKIDDLQKRMNGAGEAAAAEKTQLEKQVQDLTRSNSEAQTKVTELQTKLQEAKTASAQEKTKLEQQLQELTREQGESKQKIEELQAKLKEGEAASVEMTKLRDQVTQLQAQLKEAEAKLRDAKPADDAGGNKATRGPSEVEVRGVKIKVGFETQIGDARWRVVGQDPADGHLIVQKVGEVDLTNKKLQSLEDGSFHKVKIMGGQGEYYRRDGTDEIYKVVTVDRTLGGEKLAGHKFIVLVDEVVVKGPKSPVVSGLADAASAAAEPKPQTEGEKTGTAFGEKDKIELSRSISRELTLENGVASFRGKSMNLVEMAAKSIKEKKELLDKIEKRLAKTDGQADADPDLPQSRDELAQLQKDLKEKLAVCEAAHEQAEKHGNFQPLHDLAAKELPDRIAEAEHAARAGEGKVGDPHGAGAGGRWRACLFVFAAALPLVLIKPAPATAAPLPPVYAPTIPSR